MFIFFLFKFGSVPVPWLMGEHEQCWLAGPRNEHWKRNLESQVEDCRGGGRGMRPFCLAGMAANSTREESGSLFWGAVRGTESVVFSGLFVFCICSGKSQGDRKSQVFATTAQGLGPPALGLLGGCMCPLWATEKPKQTQQEEGGREEEERAVRKALGQQSCLPFQDLPPTPEPGGYGTS